MFVSLTSDGWGVKALSSIMNWVLNGSDSKNKTIVCLLKLMTYVGLFS